MSDNGVVVDLPQPWCSKTPIREKDFVSFAVCGAKFYCSYGEVNNNFQSISDLLHVALVAYLLARLCFKANYDGSTTNTKEQLERMEGETSRNYHP